MEKIQMPADFHDQTPEANILATEAVMNTIRTGDLLFDRIGRMLRPLGVSGAGGLVLAQLRDRGPMSPSALGERLIVTRATVTGLVDSLEKRGFVERSPHPEDRRSQIVQITPAGLKVLAKVREIVHGRETRWMSGLSDAELTRFIGFLHRVQDGLAAVEND